MRNDNLNRRSGGVSSTKLWGTGALEKRVCPSLAADPEVVAQFAKLERLSASPGGVKAFTTLNWQIDVRSILPAVRVPTLVLHRQSDVQIPIELGRELAAQIPNAKFIELAGGNHVYFTGYVEAVRGEIEEFVTGHRESSSSDFERVLATVLFTDIVNSTRSAAESGDLAWRRLLDSHDQLATQTVAKYRGCLIKTMGDGILATLKGRAARFAALWHSKPPRSRSAYRYVRVSIPAKLKSEVGISEV